MIVFFSSCELVEFHYSLFLQTLLSSSGAPASGQLPSASTRLKFLRLHGNMEQEVSTDLPVQRQHRGPTWRWGQTWVRQTCSLGSAMATTLAHSTGQVKNSMKMGDLLELEGITLLDWCGQGESIVPICFCSGSWSLPPERAHRPRLGLNLPQPAVKATEYH